MPWMLCARVRAYIYTQTHIYEYMHTDTILFKKLRHIVTLLPYKASNILFLLY